MQLVIGISVEVIDIDAFLSKQYANQGRFFSWAREYGFH